MFPPGNNKYYPTAGSETMDKLQRTLKFYPRNFIFVSRTSNERSQKSFYSTLVVLLVLKKVSLLSVCENTFICYILHNKIHMLYMLSTLHNKIDRFMETFNKTISNFETKPYEILQDNIKFLQNELRCKDQIIKTLMETQTAVLENLPLSKPPQQTENNTSFQKDVNQLNKNIVFKGQANQEYNNQSQHHVVNTQYQKSSKQQNRNHNQKSKQEKRLYIGNLDRDVKEQDLQENDRVDLPTGKMGKIKGLDLQ